ncbi:MAG: c-type cytochrome [Crocinitomicaceae bacterium]|nr:c-type cytochrome [Crocinitomicaceae bacterium]
MKYESTAIRKFFLLLIPVTGVLIINSCHKDMSVPGARVPVLPAEVYKYDSVPGDIDFNPFGQLVINNDLATLGRVLFYETQLSMNNRISCGTCHKQRFAFSDNEAFSVGFENKLTGRNTPAFINTGIQSGFFWDLREATLGSMVLKPIANHIEMGLESQSYMVRKLEALPYYAELFTKAFGSPEITTDKISRALEQFVSSIISVQSKFDIGKSANFANFTEQEEEGRQLFFHDLPCSACHGGSNLSGLSIAENIGLELDYKDNGVVGDFSPTEALDGWFKVPTVRNIAVTGPYMHDGRFKTLEEVVEFYNSGILPHRQLSTMMRKHDNGGFFFFGEDLGNHQLELQNNCFPLRMHMTSDQKAALVAFLHTLTDNRLMTDPRFADPFTLVGE